MDGEILVENGESKMENKKKMSGGDNASRIEGIDALRGFGCIAIAAWHILANGGFWIDGYMVNTIIPSWNDLVFLFMMISGFSMCYGYYERFKNNEISIETFYKRRYAKIVPFFSVLIVADVLIEHSLESLAEGFIELTMVFGLLPNNQLNVIGVAWTLGVIFVFYIAFPFIVFLVSNRRRAWLAFAVSVVIQILCQMYFMTGKFVGSNFSAKHSFLFCTPFFLAGCLMYLYRENIIAVVRKMEGLGLAICCLMTVLYYIVPHSIGTLKINEIQVLVLYALWIIYAIGTTSKLFCNRVTKFISGISMEIYLSHMLCFRVIEKIGGTRLFGTGIFSYIFVIVICLILLMLAIPLIQKLLNQVVKAFKVVTL